MIAGAGADCVRKNDLALNDLALTLQALQQVFAVIEAYEPDQRNPGRHMRRMRHILRNPDLRAAVHRLDEDAQERHVPLDARQTAS
jgi:hypothetical protein